MAMADRRIQLRLQWLEEHPEVVERVKRQIASIGQLTQKLRGILGRLTPVQKAITTGWGRFSGWIQTAVLPRLRGLSKSLQSAGWRLGWFAYRTMMVGRMLFRWLIMPIQRGTRSLVNWESAVDRAATAMGMMAVAGYLTGDRLDFMRGAIEDIIASGMALQGAFGYLGTVFTRVFAQALQPFIPGLYELGDAIWQVWESSKDTLMPLLEQLANEIFPRVIEIIREVGPAFLEGFVQGISTALPFLLDLFDTLKPFIPLIGRLMGLLLPFAPIIMGIGVAAYLLSLPLSTVGEALESLMPLFGALKSGILALASKAIPALSSAFSFLAANPIVAVILAIIAIIGILWHLYNTNEDVRKAIDGFISVLRNVAETIWNVLKGAIEWLLDALNNLSNIAKPITDFFGGIADALRNLCFKHAAPQAEQFNRVLEDTLSLSQETERNIARLGGSLRGLRGGTIGLETGNLAGTVGYGGGSVTQHINIYPSISIGTVSAEVDLDMVTDAVNKGIAEALRGRLP
jgi:hypothetical protein